MKLLSISLIAIVLWITIVNSNNIPKDMKKTGAVIVKLEHEEEAKVLKEKQMSRHLSKLWPSVKEDKDIAMLRNVLEDIERGRGKSHKYKKLTKFLYPLFMGVLIAKVVLVPLLLKMLTAISASALVMSKIALITTGFLALKWIFAGSVHDGKDHFEFIYLPTPGGGKPYRSSSDDLSWSDSNTQYAVAVPTSELQKYIPVNFKNDLSYKSYHRGGAGGGTMGGGSVGTVVSKKGLSGAANDLYYYAQHNYNNQPTDGKPFL